MAFEIITLNLIPEGEMPVFHASQFDTARPVIIDLVMGEDAYVVPEGITLELHCRKVDDNIVTMEPDEVTGNRVTFVTTEQLTACIGDNLCEVALLNGDDHIGTLNFILHVEPDPLAGGLTSETDIYNLTEQIKDIAQEVIGEDYYDKTEVDALLADKADVSDLPDMSNYYTKSQVYNKTETDALLNNKADYEDLPDMSKYYNKTETNNLLSNYVETSYLITNYYSRSDSRSIFVSKGELEIAMQLEGQASGAIATFETAAPRQWLSGLKCNFICGGGNGTPSTPIPLVPLTELTVTNVNADNQQIDEITLDLNGTLYGGYVDANNGKLVVTWGSVDLGTLSWTYDSSVPRFYSTGLSSDIKRPSSGSVKADILCDHYVTDTADNIYGATDNIIACSTGGAISVKDSRFSSQSTFTTGVSGYILAYELATPIEVDISMDHLHADPGENNVSHDGNGTTEVKYKDTIQHYIDTRL